MTDDVFKWIELTLRSSPSGRLHPSLLRSIHGLLPMFSVFLEINAGSDCEIEIRPLTNQTFGKIKGIKLLVCYAKYLHPSLCKRLPAYCFLNHTDDCFEKNLGGVGSIFTH